MKQTVFEIKVDHESNPKDLAVGLYVWGNVSTPQFEFNTLRSRQWRPVLNIQNDYAEFQDP